MSCEEDEIIFFLAFFQSRSTYLTIQPSYETELNNGTNRLSMN